jgi:putative transposase
MARDGCIWPVVLGAWVTQQARQMTWALQDRELPMRYLIHDHHTKFTAAFDTVFESEGVELVDIPYYAPNANAHAERWGTFGTR